MHKKVLLVSVLVLMLVIAFVLYRISSYSSDMWNTDKILVTAVSTGKVYEITDKKVIKNIVKVVVKNEQPGLEDIIEQDATYSLEFFTRDEGYGPLLCYEDLGICRFEKDTLGNYIDAPGQFFEWIEEAINK